jgi:hypothetical protein
MVVGGIGDGGGGSLSTIVRLGGGEDKTSSWPVGDPTDIAAPRLVQGNSAGDVGGIGAGEASTAGGFTGRGRLGR